MRDRRGKPGAAAAGRREDLQQIARPRAAGARPKSKNHFLGIEIDDLLVHFGHFAGVEQLGAGEHSGAVEVEWGVGVKQFG